MPWPFTQNNTRYALVGGRVRALLATKNQGPSGTSTATPLAWADTSLTEAKSIHQLMANISNPRGQVAISLPLEQFEVLTLSVNKVPREVVAKILPFHISKVLDSPLSNYIYDWQIVKELKDSLQVNVFLFPAQVYQDLRTILGHYKLTPTSLEPDVFSACAYLEGRGIFSREEASMLVLLWNKSVSIAIYDKQTLMLTRHILVAKPQNRQEKQPTEEQQNAEEDNFSLDPEATEPPLFAPNPDDLLANFLVETKRDDDDISGQHIPPSNAAVISDTSIDTTAPSSMQSESTYLNQISLELMRTRDYFNSVVKGNPIKTVYVAGGEDIWDSLSAELSGSLGLQVATITDQEQPASIESLYEAVSVGVLS